MNIHNDYRALEMASNEMQSRIQDLKALRKAVNADIDKLYQSGFKDKKFIELKNAIGNNVADIERAESYFERSLQELKSRVSLIKEYYAVQL
jgi:seryl-tRNA synthetase